MRIKVDENLGDRGANVLRRDGHDVMTVRAQGMGGADDTAVFRACQSEGRTLITLDRGFGEILRFQPDETAGIVILELGAAASFQRIESRLRDFLALARTRPVEGELWIVEPGRVRVYSPKTE